MLYFVFHVCLPMCWCMYAFAEDQGWLWHLSYCMSKQCLLLTPEVSLSASLASQLTRTILCPHFLHTELLPALLTHWDHRQVPTPTLALLEAGFLEIQFTGPPAYLASMLPTEVSLYPPTSQTVVSYSKTCNQYIEKYLFKDYSFSFHPM